MLPCFIVWISELKTKINFISVCVRHVEVMIMLVNLPQGTLELLVFPALQEVKKKS